MEIYVFATLYMWKKSILEGFARSEFALESSPIC
jgi:hypothetical protein